MIATRFLRSTEFSQYGDWLRKQSVETLALYFGVVVGDDYIDSLVARILANPEQHHFLVAFTSNNEWAGVIHMAHISDRNMEFGIMVHKDLRGNGIANELMAEAIVWIRNRGFDHLYLHCLNRNTAMKHIAHKHGLELHEEGGDVDAEVTLPPPSVLTYTQEALNLQKNIFWINLRQTWFPFTELHG